MRFRFFMRVVLVVAGVLFPSLAWASGSASKLQRGAVNVVSAPLEIPRQIRAYWITGAEKTDHILVWLMAGGVKGVVGSVKRFSSGALDIMTFPSSVNSDHPAWVKPDYVFQDWPVNPKSGR